MKRKQGKVYLVGAGPGDPGLITVRGLHLLNSAQVVVYDHLASVLLLEYTGPDTLKIDVGKYSGLHKVVQDQINNLLIAHGRAGKTVVRLKGGDPFIFGRGGEEAVALANAGVEFEVVPGITSGIAGPAYAGIPLTHRKLSSSAVLVTGHEDPSKDKSSINYAALAGMETVVFYMGVHNIDKCIAALIDAGKPADTPAAVIQQATTGSQRTITGTLDDIAGRAEAAQIKPPALLVIGPPVLLRDKIAWFEQKPLFGKTIALTRSATQSLRMAQQLTELGADVILAPVIQIVPQKNLQQSDQALRQLDKYDWLVLTSVNGVEVLIQSIRRLGMDGRSLAGVKLAAIGSATAQALRRYLLCPDLVPDQFTGQSLAEALAAKDDLTGKKVLMMRADRADDTLPRQLQAAGATVDDLSVYQTRRVDKLSEEFLAALSEHRIDWICFTSSSTVTCLCELLGDEYPQLLSGIKLASIGPVTTQMLKQMQLTAAIEASEHTIDGLTQAIQTFQ